MSFALKIKENIYNFMRRCGYVLEESVAGKKELAFSRPVGLSKSGYPRFHVYVKINNVSRETFIINLHLDQKKPIYKGAPAHAAEYEGKVVEKEAERIKKNLI